MITNISIKDFAIVKELNLDLHSGLNIITGETGAGKSVIIEAISMALGSRADTAYVRQGAEKAVVSLVVDTDDCNLGTYLEEIGVPADNPMVIRREISSASKSICRINGSIVPLSSLSGLCRRIADIHGQYDQQILLDVDNHIDILDLYGGEQILKLKKEVAESYTKYASFVGEYNRLKKSIAEAERNRDFLSFELKEILDAKISENEDAELEESIRVMQNSEQIYKALSSAYGDIFSSDLCADSNLGSALRSLESVSGLSKDIDDITGRISSVYYELSDMNSELRALSEKVSFSQKELDDCIERAELLGRLKKKYGGSLESVLEYARKAENKLKDIENADDQLKLLESEISSAKADFHAKSDELSFIRKSAALKFEEEIDRELSELNFTNAKFKAAFETAAPSQNGTDNVEFLIAANVGDSPKPLAKVASGGELSRVMLALKRITGDIDGVPTMIFDEIDTGISGATAAVVGEKLTSIANNHQVICITHLPQIACKGRSHYKIQKFSDEISTHTTVSPLSEEERVCEIARLLSGTSITESAKQTAKELLGYKG